MPTFVRLAGEGASGIVQTGPVTTTAPCVYSLTTGRPGSLVQAIFNFHSSETRVDSLLSSIATAGGRIAIAGDPAWHRQFALARPGGGAARVPRARHHDRAPHRRLRRRRRGLHPREATATRSYRLLILHLGSLDAVGHMVTPLVPALRGAAEVPRWPGRARGRGDRPPHHAAPGDRRPRHGAARHAWRRGGSAPHTLRPGRPGRPPGREAGRPSDRTHVDLVRPARAPVSARSRNTRPSPPCSTARPRTSKPSRPSTSRANVALPPASRAVRRPWQPTVSTTRPTAR